MTTQTTTTTTIATAIEMVLATEFNTAAQIESFVVAQGKKITVAMLEEALTELMVAFTTKQTKAVKTNLFARALEMDINEYRAALAVEPTQVEEAPAVDESSAAGNQTNTQIEEETTVKQSYLATDDKGRSLSYDNANNATMMMISKMTQGDNLGLVEHHAYENPAIKDMLDKVNMGAEFYLKNVGEHEIKMTRVAMYPEKSKATREQVRAGMYVKTDRFKRTTIGEVTVQVPAKYMVMKVWNEKLVRPNGEKGMFEEVPFENYDMNVVKTTDIRKALPNGSGKLVLPIREDKDGYATVALPMSYSKKKNQYYQKFSTSDARFAKTKDAEYIDQPLFLDDNSRTFNAMVTQMVRTYLSESFIENPANRNGFNESCASCPNFCGLQTRDGVTDDMDTESKKSRAVLEQPDVMQLAQSGEYQPSGFCMVRNEFVDKEAVLLMNELTKADRDYYVDENGNYRYLAANEVMYKGKAVKPHEIREEALATKASSCVWYHGNSAKGEAQVAKERTELREKAGNNDAKVYANPFYRTHARPGRQAFQTLVDDGGKLVWVNKYLGELDPAVVTHGVRIKSGATAVYATPELFEHFEDSFVPEIEEFDARRAEVMKKINQIYFLAFNMAKVEQAQADMVFEMAANKPEGLTDDESRRWDKAVFWLTEAIGWAEDREAAENIEFFARKFHAVDTEHSVHIDIDKVMAEKLERLGHSEFKSMNDLMAKDGEVADEDGKQQYNVNRGDYIHAVYDDLEGHELARYLDEGAMEFIYNVLIHGTEYTIVGGTDADNELAADAMQFLLQSELTRKWERYADGASRDSSLAGAIRRDADPTQALAELMLCDEVKAYLSEVTGTPTK